MSLFSTTADIRDDIEEWEPLPQSNDAAALYLFPTLDDEPDLDLDEQDKRQRARKLATALVAVTAIAALAFWLAMPAVQEQLEILPIDPVVPGTVAVTMSQPGNTESKPTSLTDVATDMATDMATTEPKPVITDLALNDAITGSVAPVVSPWPASIENRFRALLDVAPTLFAPQFTTEPELSSTQVAAASEPQDFSVIRITEPAMETHVLNDVRLKLFNGERDQAKYLLLDLIETYPPAFEAKRVLAGLLLQEGSHEEARQVLSSVNADAPAALREMKAQYLLQQNQVRDAVNLLEHNPPDIDSGTRYFALLAALLQQDGRFADSLSVYRELLAVEPENSNWHVGYAIGHEHTGNIASALDGYEAAMTAGPVSIVMEQFIHGKIRELSFR